MRKIISATLHDSMHQPGIGTIGPKLSSLPDPVIKPVTMTISDDGQTLFVGIQKVTLSVPIHNVKYYVAE